MAARVVERSRGERTGTASRALRNRRRTRTVSLAMKLRAIGLLCALLAGCGTAIPTASAGISDTTISPSATALLNPSLHITNGTTLTVTLVVNGQRVWDLSPGSPAPGIDVADLPPVPWSVEARSPSGRVLVSMQVQPGDGQAYTSKAQLADLSCGRLWIWVGDVTPDAPKEPSPAPSGDCAP